VSVPLPEFQTWKVWLDAFEPFTQVVLMDDGAFSEIVGAAGDVTFAVGFTVRFTGIF
jgi:hypothetical protein